VSGGLNFPVDLIVILRHLGEEDVRSLERPIELIGDGGPDSWVVFVKKAKAAGAEPLPRKARHERKMRHRSRVQKLAARPKVRQGRFFSAEELEDERHWFVDV
jgi:hypothetical protein